MVVVVVVFSFSPDLSLNVSLMKLANKVDDCVGVDVCLCGNLCLPLGRPLVLVLSEWLGSFSLEHTFTLCSKHTSVSGGHTNIELKVSNHTFFFEIKLIFLSRR